MATKKTGTAKKSSATLERREPAAARGKAKSRFALQFSIVEITPQLDNSEIRQIRCEFCGDLNRVLSDPDLERTIRNVAKKLERK